MTIPDPRSVWCPACRVLSGEPCRSLGGTEVAWHHMARIDNAAHQPVAERHE